MIEHAVTFPIASAALVGVVTEEPPRNGRPRPGVVLLNAGLLHRVGPNRLSVRIARTVARHGFPALRFDLSGIGDSPRRTDALPPRMAALEEVRQALDFLVATRSVETFIVVGLCSGADLAFRAALGDPRVAGVVLIDGLPYRTPRSRVYERWRRVRAAARWEGRLRLLAAIRRRARRVWAQPPRPRQAHRDVPARRDAEAGLRALVDRGVRLLVVYTNGRGYCYERQFRDLFPSLPPSAVQVEFFRDAQHTFSLVGNQDRLVRTIEDWIARS